MQSMVGTESRGTNEPGSLVPREGISLLGVWSYIRLQTFWAKATGSSTGRPSTSSA